MDVLNSNNVYTTDCRYIQLFEEYTKMKQQKEKMGYVIGFLGEKYGLSERGVYKVIGRMSKTIEL